jgi:hypothetical protein
MFRARAFVRDLGPRSPLRIRRGTAFSLCRCPPGPWCISMDPSLCEANGLDFGERPNRCTVVRHIGIGVNDRFYARRLLVSRASNDHSPYECPTRTARVSRPRTEASWTLAALSERLPMRQAVEAVRCEAEGVVTHAHDANVGSVLGFGFPAWKGAYSNTSQPWGGTGSWREPMRLLQRMAGGSSHESTPPRACPARQRPKAWPTSTARPSPSCRTVCHLPAYWSHLFSAYRSREQPESKAPSKDSSLSGFDLAGKTLADHGG